MSMADMPWSHRQQQLIDIFRQQLGLTQTEIDDMVRAHGGGAESVPTRKIAGAVIIDLQRLKQEQQRRPQP